MENHQTEAEQSDRRSDSHSDGSDDGDGRGGSHPTSVSDGQSNDERRSITIVKDRSKGIFGNEKTISELEEEIAGLKADQPPEITLRDDIKPGTELFKQGKYRLVYDPLWSEVESSDSRRRFRHPEKPYVVYDGDRRVVTSHSEEWAKKQLIRQAEREDMV
tara:strand:- start:1234 stop:1716 length:483 start_codon:yes stop_codon:yes gene_type:complete